MPAHFHFAENSLALHFFLENTERLLDIIIFYNYLNQMTILLGVWCMLFL